MEGTNYDEWACGMKTEMTSCKKVGFLDGTIVQATRALLVDVAKAIWDFLKKIFDVMNSSRIQQIKYELACCIQRGIAIEAYFGKLNQILDGLTLYRLIRKYQCWLCTCDHATAQETDHEEDKVHQLLCGLDDQF
ncbi:hypothetical protein CARUB_v10011026mg [Capsella rubella]|uniref:Retrotransposon Copia-like N-terminal domain-containing protein n=1 Tax=Capsella rubella TaxID=81985 RepID=R0I8S7_9BRAS|nr:hypothetical protein CARUB_v10011026mg [Capsella rubella]